MEDNLNLTKDPHYDLSVHPAFASECTVTHKDGTVKRLYKQQAKHDCRPKGHPKKHVIKLKGKNGNTRDITITIEDNTYAIHSLKLELYDPSRDVNDKDKYNPGTTETFTVMNSAETCPPDCGGT